MGALLTDTATDTAPAGPQHSVLRDVLRRSAWMAAGTLIGRGLPVASTALLSRSVGVAAYATVGAVVSWTALMPALTTAGIGMVVTQRLAQVDSASPQGRAVVRQGLLAGLGAVLGLHLVLAVLGADVLSRLLPSVITPGTGHVALLLSALSACIALCQAVLLGAHQPRRAALVAAGNGVLQGTGLCVGALLGSTRLALLGVGVALALSLGVSAVFVQRLGRGSRSAPVGRALPWTTFLAQAGLATVSTALVAPVTFLCVSFLAHTPDGARQVGGFLILEQLYLVIGYLPNLVAQASMPVLAATMARAQDPGGAGLAVSGYLRRMLGVLLLMGALLLGGGWWVTEPLLRLYGLDPALFGTAYHLMLPTAILMVPSATLGAFIQARGRFIEGSSLNLFWALLFVGLSIVALDRGAAGVQGARLTATFALVTVLSVYVWRLGRSRPPPVPPPVS